MDAFHLIKEKVNIWTAMTKIEDLRDFRLSYWISNVYITNLVHLYFSVFFSFLFFLLQSTFVIFRDKSLYFMLTFIFDRKNYGKFLIFSYAQSKSLFSFRNAIINFEININRNLHRDFYIPIWLIIANINLLIKFPHYHLKKKVFHLRGENPSTTSRGGFRILSILVEVKWHWNV